MHAHPADLEPELTRLIDTLPELGGPEDATAQLRRLEQAAALARAQGAGNDTLGRIELLRAQLDVRLGQPDRAYAHAVLAKELLDRAGDRLRAANAAATCIAICIETSDFGRALDHLRVAQAEARAARDLPLLARLLFSQARTFLCVNEFEAAARCCEEVLRVAATDGVPAMAEARENARAALAFSRAQLAQACERRGRPAEARAQHLLATDALSPSSLASPFESLHMVVHARALLGDIDGARRSATHFLHLARRRRRLPRRTALVWLTLGIYYQHAGRPEKGVVRFERSLRAMSSVLRDGELTDTMQMLAHAHASNGRHADALRWLRRAHAARQSSQPEQERLRYRVAALERDAESRRLERETELLHAQRLAVVGRLMAQIYHALEAPLNVVHETLQDCIEGAERLSPPELSTALSDVVARIDQAAMLARQLKMFSYRATPQTMALDLGMALQEAWRGLAIGRPGAAQALVVYGPPPPQVRCDAQRLAVLLRILMIEIGRVAVAADVQAELSTSGAAVRVVFACADGTAGRAGAAVPVPSVGFTLCEEIAVEMQGGLWRMETRPGELRLALELPADR